MAEQRLAAAAGGGGGAAGGALAGHQFKLAQCKAKVGRARAEAAAAAEQCAAAAATLGKRCAGHTAALQALGGQAFADQRAALSRLMSPGAAFPPALFPETQVLLGQALNDRLLGGGPRKGAARKLKEQVAAVVSQTSDAEGQAATALTAGRDQLAQLQSALAAYAGALLGPGGHAYAPHPPAAAGGGGGGGGGGATGAAAAYAAGTTLMAWCRVCEETQVTMVPSHLLAPKCHSKRKSMGFVHRPSLNRHTQIKEVAATAGINKEEAENVTASEVAQEITFGDQPSSGAEEVTLPEDISDEAIAASARAARARCESLGTEAAAAGALHQALAPLVAATDLPGATARLAAWLRDAISTLCLDTARGVNTSELASFMLYTMEQAISLETVEPSDEVIEQLLGNEAAGAIKQLLQVYQEDTVLLVRHGVHNLSELCQTSSQIEGILLISQGLVKTHPQANSLFEQHLKNLEASLGIVQGVRAVETSLQELDAAVAAARAAAAAGAPGGVGGGGGRVEAALAGWVRGLGEVARAAAGWLGRRDAAARQRAQTEQAIVDLEAELEIQEDTSNITSDLVAKRAVLMQVMGASEYLSANDTPLQLPTFRHDAMPSSQSQQIVQTPTRSHQAELGALRGQWQAFFAADAPRHGPLHMLLVSVDSLFAHLEGWLCKLHESETEWESTGGLPALYQKVDVLGSAFHSGSLFCDKVKIIRRTLELMLNSPPESTIEATGLQPESGALWSEMSLALYNIINYAVKDNINFVMADVINKMLFHCCQQTIDMKPEECESNQDYLNIFLESAKQHMAMPKDVAGLKGMFSVAVTVPTLQKVTGWGPRAAPRLAGRARLLARRLRAALWHDDGWLEEGGAAAPHRESPPAAGAPPPPPAARPAALAALRAAHGALASGAVPALARAREATARARARARDALAELKCSAIEIQRWDQQLNERFRSVNNFCHLVTQGMEYCQQVLDLEAYRVDMRGAGRPGVGALRAFDAGMVAAAGGFTRALAALRAERLSVSSMESLVKEAQNTEFKIQQEIKQNQLILKEASPIDQNSAEVRKNLSTLLNQLRLLQQEIPDLISLLSTNTNTNLVFSCGEMKQAIDSFYQSLSKLETENEADNEDQEENGATKIILSDCRAASDVLSELSGSTSQLVCLLSVLYSHMPQLEAAAREGGKPRAGPPPPPGAAPSPVEAAVAALGVATQAAVPALLLGPTINPLSAPAAPAAAAAAPAAVLGELPDQWAAALRVVDEFVGAASALSTHESQTVKKSEQGTGSAVGLASSTGEDQLAPFSAGSTPAAEMIDSKGSAILSETGQQNNATDESGGVKEPSLLPSLTKQGSRTGSRSGTQILQDDNNATNNNAVKQSSDMRSHGGKLGGSSSATATGTAGSGKQAAVQNAYALKILRDVELKLDGKYESRKLDLSPAASKNDENHQQQTGLSIQDHVELLIRQATSEDLLCVMYEGWTSWI